MDSRLHDFLQSEHGRGYSLLRSECRSTLGRLNVAHVDQNACKHFGTFVVDSGDLHGSTTNPPDHTLCTNTAELYILDVPRELPEGVEYLQGLGSILAHNVTNNPSTYADDPSNDYYHQIEPFGEFKALWGFDGTETNALYQFRRSRLRAGHALHLDRRRRGPHGWVLTASPVLWRSASPAR
jgi:hypothetical protein